MDKSAEYVFDGARVREVAEVMRALMAVAEQRNPSVWLPGAWKARSASFHLFMPRLPVTR